MWTRSELKERARVNLHQSYWGLVLISLIMGFAAGSSGGSTSSSGTSIRSSMQSMQYGISREVMIGIIVGMLVVGILVFAFSLALVTFLAGPLEVGADRYLINAAYAPQTVSDMKCVGLSFRSENYKNVFTIMFFRYLYTFLWSLLLIIPGIIKAYEYRMIPYILAENPNISREEAFSLSKQMMDGEKLNAWVLDLSFIGWMLLSVCTCGILSVFYVNPYIYMTRAHLYLTLKNKAPFYVTEMPNMYNQQQTYQANAQQPSGYDAYGQPVYGQQNAQAQQQAYGYSYDTNQQGYGYQANAGQNPYGAPEAQQGYGYQANAGQNPYGAPEAQQGYGYQANAGQNPYGAPEAQQGYGSNAEAGQNPYGNDGNQNAQ